MVLFNAFYNNLKKWIDDKFNGVSAKYLANYMYWFKWLQFFNTEKDTEKDTVKSKHLLAKSHIPHSDIKLKDFKVREANLV